MNLNGLRDRRDSSFVPAATHAHIATWSGSSLGARANEHQFVGVIGDATRLEDFVAFR
jgi:hypothetical protein